MKPSEKRELTDKQWRRVERMLPQPKGRHGGDDRLFIEAVLWIGRTGAPWRELPERFGPWSTTYKRYARWSDRGHFEFIFIALQGRAGEVSETQIDSSSCKAHKAASGAQKKEAPRRLAALAGAWAQKSTPSQTGSAGR